MGRFHSGGGDKGVPEQKRGIDIAGAVGGKPEASGILFQDPLVERGMFTEGKLAFSRFYDEAILQQGLEGTLDILFCYRAGRQLFQQVVEGGRVSGLIEEGKDVMS
jgi:hypothetical protein